MTAPRFTGLLTREHLAASELDGPHGDHRLCPPHLCRAVVDETQSFDLQAGVAGVAPADPLELFGQLVREVDAARTLLVLTEEGDPRRRAALDGLAMARAVLDDARDLYAGPALVQL